MGLHGWCRSVYACVRIGYNNQVSCSPGDYIAVMMLSTEWYCIVTFSLTKAREQ